MWDLAGSPLVGRDGEMRQLAAALERAAGGRGGVALVGVEAGSGRTRLCREAGCRHAERGGRVLPAGAYPEDATTALGPVADSLRAARRGEPSLWAAARARAAVLRAVLPELAGEGRGGGDADPAVLFEALLDAVEESAGGRTTLWVLDDVQWADVATLAFVRYAARRVPDMRLVLAVTYREEEVGPGHPWWADLARLRRDPHVADVRLRRLGCADAGRLASAAAPGLPPAAVAAIVARGAGTPLLVRELARSAAAAPQAPAPLPDAVLATLRERTTRLGAAARELLHVAALAGVEVDEALLGRLRPAAPADELVAAGLMTREAGRLRFRHPLLWEAARHEVPAARRPELQREVARPRTDAAGPLSPRELEVAGLVAEGLSNPAIASRLFVSRPTVASHVAHILTKLGFQSRAQIAAWVAGHEPDRRSARLTAGAVDRTLRYGPEPARSA